MLRVCSGEGAEGAKHRPRRRWPPGRTSHLFCHHRAMSCRILFVLFPGFQQLDLAGPMAVFE
ncbi:MAG: hypothetical protein ACOVOG_13695, partial [Rubrivivax sp.]